MNKVRRLLLVSVPHVILGGCVENNRSESDETEQKNRENMTERGQGGEITVKRTIDDDGIEYFEKNNSVKYRSGTASIYDENSSEPTTKAEYSVITFSQWSKTKCATIAAEALNEELKQKFETSLTGISGAVNHAKEKKEVYVDYSVTRNQDGEVVEEPKIPFNDVVSATPSRIAVTIILEGNKHEETYDIKVKKSTKVQQ